MATSDERKILSSMQARELLNLFGGYGESALVLRDCITVSVSWTQWRNEANLQGVLVPHQSMEDNGHTDLWWMRWRWMSSQRYRSGFQIYFWNLLDISSGVAEVCQRQVPGGPGDDTVGAILFLKFRIVDWFESYVQCTVHVSKTKYVRCLRNHFQHLFTHIITHTRTVVHLHSCSLS